MGEDKKIGSTRVVPGEEWLSGKVVQDREWKSLRRKFDAYVVEQGLTVKGDPIETTEYDEKDRRVWLRIVGRAR